MIFGRKKTEEPKDTYDYRRRAAELEFDKKLLRENTRILKASQFNCEIAVLIDDGTRLLKKYIRDVENFNYEDRDEIFDEINSLIKNLRDYADLLREIDSIVYTLDEEDEDYGSGRKTDFKFLGKHDDIYEEKCCDYADKYCLFDDDVKGDSDE